MYKTGQLVKSYGRVHKFLRHYGILLVDAKGNVYIVHNSSNKPSVLELFTDFEKERTIISISDTHLTNRSFEFVKNRYDNCRKPYNAISYNCEHFIYCMLGKPIRSEQLEFWTVHLPVMAFILRRVLK